MEGFFFLVTDVSDYNICKKKNLKSFCYGETVKPVQ